jgi:hypothetical protein
MSEGTHTEHLDGAPKVTPELRAKILGDPNVAKMAAELGLSVDEFVNQIGYYMNNPGTEPGFLVATDEKLRSIGVEPPSAEALEANVRASVAAIQAGQAPSGFDGAKKQAVELPSTGGEAVKPGASNPDLDDAIKKARTPRKG